MSVSGKTRSARHSKLLLSWKSAALWSLPGWIRKTIMDESLTQIVGMLAVAMIVALAARRFKLPYTVGLVVVGAVLALSKADFGLHLTHDFIFDLILPPLLFEAAITLSWPQLRRDILPILVLSTFGTIVSAGVVAWGMAWLLGWPMPSALVFGALIAATDPVAIIAMFKDNKVKGRLRLLVESESLFNDGAAAVLFVMALAWSQSAENAQTSIEMIGTMVLIVAGGIAIGAVCGGAALIVAWRSSEHLIEAALTMVAAYGSFLVAEYFHVSGVLATVTAGLMMANFRLLRGKSFLSSEGPGIHSRLLGFCGVSRQFGGLSSHRRHCRDDAVPVLRDSGSSDLGCCCAPWSRPDGLSAQPSLSALPLGDFASRTAYPLVGRVARRSGACSGALHAAHTAAAR